MKQDEELHSELMNLFRQYFEANQRWLNEGTKRAGMDVRRILSEIRRVSKDRRAHIMDWRYWKNGDWEIKKAKRQEKKAQKQQGSGDGHAN